MAIILIPTPLRSCTGGAATVDVPGSTVGDVVAALVAAHPRLRPQLLDEAGALRRFVNLFLNDRDIRGLDGERTATAPGDRLEILPAIAGGSGAPRTLASWRRELEAALPAIDPASLAPGGGDWLMIDVRTAAEWESGHIPGAVHIDRGFLEMRIAAAAPDPERPILCYCQSGVRSLFAAATLAQMGYGRVASLAGGFEAWRAAGGTPAVPPRLSSEAAERYRRHLAIPEFGIEKQVLLAGKRVLLIGAGGLGCPVALYLSAAGVGSLTLVDDDRVDASNLQRQILYTPEMIGQPKADCARALLQRFNPLIEVHARRERLDDAGARALFPDYDLVIDGTDNFRSRYLINDAAIACGVPVVYGAIYRFNGQVAVFGAGASACYRCLYPEPPPPELAPSCAEGGVLGVLPGTIGLLMATEAIKLLAGIGAPLSNRLLTYDALDARFRELHFERRADCAACGAGAAADLAEPAPLLCMAGG